MRLFLLLIVVFLLTIYSHAQVIQQPDCETDGVNPEMTPSPSISSPSGFTSIHVHPSTTTHQTETSIAIFFSRSATPAFYQ